MSTQTATFLKGRKKDVAPLLPDGVSVTGVGTVATLHATSSASIAGVATFNGSGAYIAGVVTTTTFSGNLSGTGVTATNFTGDLTGNVTGTVTGITAGSSLTIGDLTVGTGSTIFVGDKALGGAHIGEHSVGVGTTDTTGRDAGVGTATGTLVYNSSTKKLNIYTGDSAGWFNAT